MKISIIIPTYNSGKTIGIALKSINEQSFLDYEVLIIDNNSTDNTVNTVADYQKINNKIKLFQENDKGIYDAMNKGVSYAKGEWMYFMGSDDSFYSNEILVHLFSNVRNDIDVFYGNVVSPQFKSKYDGEFDVYKIFEKNICHQSIFVKRNVFKVLGFFDLKYKSCADWEHNLRWFLSDLFKKQYMDIIIANYGEGGFSANHIDLEFKKDKVEKMLTYDKSTIPLSFKTQLLKIITFEKYTQKKYIESIWYYIRLQYSKLKIK